eukprot:TRINITY_DN1143_c0_g1_i1.p1 TRINITY_DN1143_c0_g1~~TRINITY_DN1143_c0_g1_i1.p1  ORF type:complete len:1111 (+),score=249.64 TRINITY_DN1143_c0_g1_i1:599-3931(+)
MGVHGLWQLLAPVGRRVSNEHVRHKVLAVDVSIWLTQLVKAMRDAQGATLRNAHLLGVLRRCVKLLFLSVRPVLVFDGTTPAIKRRAVAARRALRQRHEAKLRTLAEKMLLNRLRHRVLADAMAAELPQPAATQQPSRSQKADCDRQHAQLPSHAPQLHHAALTDDAHRRSQETHSDHEQLQLPSDVQQLHDAALIELPPRLQAQLFKQVKQQQRLRHRQNMLRQQHNPTHFSKAQIDGFLTHTALNRKICNVRNLINRNAGVSNRIASDSRRQFVFEELPASEHPHAHAYSDSDHDIVHTTSDAPAPDILSRIRAANQRVAENATTRAAGVPQSADERSQPLSGVAWASRVLSGHGGLQLSTMASPQLPHALSEDDELHSQQSSAPHSPHHAMGSAYHHHHHPPPSHPTHAARNDSDSDDVEWEDGAANSDSELSQRSLELAHSSKPMSPKATHVSQHNVLTTRGGTEARAVSSSQRLDGGMQRAALRRQPADAKRREASSEMQCAREGWHQSADESVRVSIDAEALHERASMRQSKRCGTALTSTAAAARSVRDEAVKRTQHELHARVGETQQPHVHPKTCSRSPLRDVSRDDRDEQKASPKTSVHKCPSLDDISQGDSILPDKRALENSSTRRKSRTVHEEDDDIQLAIALSLRENGTELPQSSQSDLSSSGKERIQHQNSGKHDSDKGSKEVVTERRETVEHTANAPDQDKCSKAADADIGVRKEVPPTAETEAEVPDPAGEVTLMEMERLYAELDTEADQFKKQRQTHASAIETISDEMYAETRDLLKLLGIPYLEAPMEAEAQCAFLNTANVVDGVITEDSDAFLFGAKVVYRQLFADGRFAETYEARDIKSSLGLDRAHLIRLAHLLGSDYTPGVRGVGIVNAMEIMEAFPGEAGLSEFLEWTKKVTILDKQPEESVMNGTSADAVRRRFCWKHRNMKRNWVIREGFPNPAVTEAYLKPTIDDNKERFRWREIDFGGLARFCWEKFGWERETFESAVGPLKKELVKRKGLQQTRIPEFFKPHRFAKIRSTRLQQAVKGMTGEEVDDIMAALVPRIKRRKTSAMTYNATIDLTSEEEEQMLKLLEEAEDKSNIHNTTTRRNNSQ